VSLHIIVSSIVLVQLALASPVHLMNKTPREQLSVDESAPLLDIISRLGHVTVIDIGPYEKASFPYICWIDSTSFRLLGSTLARYPGAFRWVVVAKPPRRWLQIEPNPFRGESPFYGTDSAALDPQGVAKVAETFEKFGVNAPWRNSPLVDPTDYRARLLEELPKVAAFIEKELKLEDKPSLGIDVSTNRLELPLIEDHEGSRSVILAADPDLYAFERVPTSDLDRTVHYWVTGEEEYVLMDAIANTGGNYDENWPLLWEVAGAHDGGAAILAQDVHRLAQEAESFRSRTQDTKLKDVLRRLVSVCRSAQNYRLGIYISGQ
jgi:hypothetical protein